MMVPKKSLILAGAALALLGASSSAQSQSGKVFARYNKPLKSVALDLETGVITHTPAVGNKTVPTCANFTNVDLGGFVGVDTGNKFCEWFSAGIDGAGCDTDMMVSILFAYCSGKLHVESGGPGGSVRLGFYEGYSVGGGLPTTPCAVFTLTGLPGNSASSSFFGGFTCYFIRVTFGGVIICRKGDIGYSWHFMDVGNDGVLACTFPFLSCVQSCSGPGPDGQGMVDLIDEYCPSGVFPPRATFSFGTTPFGGYFTSISMRIEKLVEQPGTVASYGGNQGCNNDCWFGTANVTGTVIPTPAAGAAPNVVVIGQPWGPDVRLGCTAHQAAPGPACPAPNGHGASGVISVKVLFVGAAINGPCPPAASAPYNKRVELLSSGPVVLTVGGSHNGTTGTFPDQSVPKDIAFLGGDWACYADVVGATCRDRSATLFGKIGNTY